MRFGKKLPPVDPFEFVDKYSDEELCDVGEKLMSKLMDVTDWFRKAKADHTEFVNDVFELAKKEWQGVARLVIKNTMFGGMKDLQSTIDEYVSDKPNLDRLILKLQQGAALAMVKEPVDALSRQGEPPLPMTFVKEPS